MRKEQRPEPINLMQRFGNRYRITFDPAYNPTDVPRNKLDPWMIIIPGTYGEIYPDGGDYLRIDIDGHNKVASRVAALPRCVLVQDGDFEKTIRFHIDQFEMVADIVKLRHKRRVSKTERKRLGSLSSRHGFGGSAVHQPDAIPARQIDANVTG